MASKRKHLKRRIQYIGYIVQVNCNNIIDIKNIAETTSINDETWMSRTMNLFRFTPHFIILILSISISFSKNFKRLNTNARNEKQSLTISKQSIACLILPKVVNSNSK